MHVRMKNPLNSVNKVLLTVIVSLLCYSGLSPGGRTARTMIPFKGTASGGTLVIGDSLNRSAHFVSINTSAGESEESVVKRLARAIAYSDSIFEYGRLRGQVDREAIAASMALGSKLRIKGFPGEYFLAGTETGLGIPKPPLFLSCSYDKKNDKLELNWVNPPGEYDSIRIKWHYNNGDTWGGDFLPGTPTNYTIHRKKKSVGLNDLDVWLFGFRHAIPRDANDNITLCDNATPSGAIAIFISSNGHCQEETYGIPFARGVAPNWTTWSTTEKPDRADFGQGDKFTDLPFYNPAKTLLTKPFYQVIKAPSQGAAHGVYRKFLGLTPGHTYRLTACLTTLKMDSVNEDWSLSLCATHNGPDGKDLTAQQLAGLSSLPDGRIGSQAGNIASYSQGNTTKGDFSIVLSEAGSLNSHITLPDGVDTITVWIRFSCSDPKGKIGFSGVKLEDISANPNPKSPEQIKEDEFKEEARLIKWIEKASRR